MHAILLLQMQLNGIHRMFQEVAGDITDTEWTTPAFPGANLPGFLCWHAVRTRDWAIHTLIRGVPEVVANERWSAWEGLVQAGVGAGIPLEQANEVAHLVTRSDVLAYAEAVHASLQSWLNGLSDSDLDTVPEAEAHMAAYPAYQQPGFRAETADLLGVPIWRLLSGPCSGHIREHVGELNVLKQFLRAK
jgi:hypothetical protein